MCVLYAGKTLIGNKFIPGQSDDLSRDFYFCGQYPLRAAESMNVNAVRCGVCSAVGRDKHMHTDSKIIEKGRKKWRM